MNLLLCLLLPGLGLASATTPFTDINYGHFEVHIGYTPTPGNPDAGWRLTPSHHPSAEFTDPTGIVRLDAASTVFVASPATRGTITSDLSVLGPVGSPLWRLPQGSVLGTPFLGVRTTMDPGIFQTLVGSNYSPSATGSVSLRLVSVTGTGPAAGGFFAVWENPMFGGPPVFDFNTSDGITSADFISTIPTASHTHYHWGMTKPGTYHVTFEVSGKLMPAYGGALTSARETFTFSVPFSSRLAAGSGMRLAEAPGGSLALVGADPAASVSYAADQGFFEAMQPAGAAAGLVPGAVWEHQGFLCGAPAAIANGVGIPPAAAAAGLAAADWSGLQLRLLSKRGPGEVAFIDGGTLLAGSAGGIGPGDVIPLAAGTQRPLTAAFTATGLYRITFTLHGVRHGQPVESGPFTLHFGAGLTIDHSYAQWRDSWERTAGLAPGALGGYTADYDGDGVSNGAEFMLGWHGFDPTRADGWRMPRPFPTTEGHAAFDFMRDTYKDRFDETNWQLLPEASERLQTWRRRSSRINGDPLGLWETGAERGNAYGRIMQRRLRLVEPVGPRAFFRFTIVPPP